MSPRERLLVVGPIPPPYHGVSVSTSLVLGNAGLREHFDVEHLDTSDNRPVGRIGGWDLVNVALGLRHSAQFASRLRGRRGLVYLPLSQNRGGFARDAILIQLASRAGWRVAAHLRGSEFLDFFYDRQPAVVQSAVRSTLRSLDSLGVMGPSLRGLFDGLLPRDRIAVVSNGTPDPGVRANIEGSTVLYLSNLRIRKGVREAVEAARIVLAADRQARFVFAGEPQSPELETELRGRLGDYSTRVSFLGRVGGDEKRHVLETSSILLFPPVDPEGHPRVVLEAIAAGMPVVTTDRGAIRDTITDGEHGYVLSEPDPEEIADRLLRLLRDPELRRTMGAAARERYLSSFTQAQADRWLVEWLRRTAAADGAGSAT